MSHGMRDFLGPSVYVELCIRCHNSYESIAHLVKLDILERYPPDGSTSSVALSHGKEARFYQRAGSALKTLRSHRRLPHSRRQMLEAQIEGLLGPDWREYTLDYLEVQRRLYQPQKMRLPANMDFARYVEAVGEVAVAREWSDHFSRWLKGVSGDGSTAVSRILGQHGCEHSMSVT